MPAQTSASVIKKGNEADEKTIDAVMGKFASSFKAGNGAVFCRCDVHSGIGKPWEGEESFRELTAMMRGMKEEEIVNSWKTTKPYLYVRAKRTNTR